MTPPPRAAAPRTLSVCIATHDRVEPLQATLAGLALQRRPPLELVVSDSAGGAAGEAAAAAVRAAARVMSGTAVRYLPSPRRALPWQRWWAARDVLGDVVLFLDDDVVLRDDALERLLDAYAVLGGAEPVAGVGFVESTPDTLGAARAPGVRERWLGVAGYTAGAVTPGGLTVGLPRPDAAALVRVAWLWGGGMSYPRAVLARVGHLDHLSALYEARLGKGEDAVLSVQASRHGALYVLAEPLARHLEPAGSAPRANAQAGWRRGLWGTWGRAHTMRWVAADPAACRRGWTRLAVLETARSAAALARSPWRAERWARLAGSVVGGARALRRWDALPPSPGSGPGPGPGSGTGTGMEAGA